MANLFRLILVVLLCLSAYTAYAQGASVAPTYTWRDSNSGPPMADGAACLARAKSVWDSGNGSSLSCRTWSDYAATVNGLPAVASRLGGCAGGELACFASSPVCPAGYTLVGQSCVPTGVPQCRADQVPDGAGGCKCPAGTSQPADGSGTCTPTDDKTDDKTCADAALLHNSIGMDRVGRISGKHPLGVEVKVCRDSGATGNSGQPLGCAHSFTGESSFEYPGGWVTEGESWANTDSSSGNGVGLACALGVDKDPNKPEDADKVPEEKKPPATCRNGYSGTVNGVNVCIDRASGEQNGVDSVRVTDGNGSQTDLRTSVSCVRDNCTVTQDKTPTGGGTTTTTVTNNVDRAQFCRSNPKNPVCGASTGSATKPGGTTGGGSGNGDSGGGDGDGDGEEEKSSFGGSCGAWTCNGDAIQCAIAKEQHKRACELFDAVESPEYKLYAEKKSITGKVTDDLEGNKEIDLAGIVSSADQFLGGGGQCPADVQIPMLGFGSFTLSFTPICPSLALLGHVLVICASLGAAFIVVGKA